jgi:hypothetical protein
MVEPLYRTRTRLTGERRLRIGWLGRLVLQVRVRVERMHPWSPTTIDSVTHSWRDARPGDLLRAPSIAELSPAPSEAHNQ